MRMRLGVRRGDSHEPEHHEEGFRAGMTLPVRLGRGLTSHGTGHAAGAGELQIGAGPGRAGARKMARVPPGTWPARAP
jgi:hypothetical protein